MSIADKQKQAMVLHSLFECHGLISLYFVIDVLSVNLPYQPLLIVNEFHFFFIF